MSFELPALPYAKDALAPHISAETIDKSPGSTGIFKTFFIFLAE